MHISKPKVIVELGSGQGALATAASKKWIYADVITVDVDQSTTHSLQQLAQINRGSHAHFIHDALDDELANRIGISLGSVDAAVCNPPYVRPRWRASFGRILEDAGLSGALQSVHDAGADLLFIAQNLRFLKQYGKLGLILPDGLITAEKYAGIRRALLREHLVEQVIQLPRSVFTKTEAQTYLVILTKMGGTTESVLLRKISREGSVLPPISIPADLAQRRMDYTYHTSLHHRKPNSPLNQQKFIRDLVLSIKRGSIGSHEIAKFSHPVFHLKDFHIGKLNIPKRFCLSQHTLKTLPERTRISLPGDILVARIGRNLHEKIAFVQHGPCLVSDCVFTIRTTTENAKILLSFLESENGRQALKASSHGVGAQYLSTNDLLEIEVIE